MINITVEKHLRAYQGEQVLKLSHMFATGSITKVYGPSGAGKTTFLKIIAGLLTPKKGKIIVDDEVWLDTDNVVNMAPQKRRPGFVFQDYALFPNMSVLQHLQYVTDETDWINRLLQLGKLEALVHHKPVHLSGGQQQRLAILRALAIKPKLMLMDEPFSALDPDMKIELIMGLKALFQELNITALIVSHNPYELEEIADGEIYIK